HYRFGLGDKKADQLLQRLARLKNHAGRTILEANLYQPETWREISDLNNGHGFDLITCRPEGPFGRNSHKDLQTIKDVESSSNRKEEILLMFLEKALKLLSPEGGTLLLQIPVVETNTQTAKEFWDNYIERKNK